MSWQPYLPGYNRHAKRWQQMSDQERGSLIMAYPLVPYETLMQWAWSEDPRTLGAQEHMAHLKETIERRIGVSL